MATAARLGDGEFPTGLTVAQVCDRVRDRPGHCELNDGTAFGSGAIALNPLGMPVVFQAPRP